MSDFFTGPPDPRDVTAALLVQEPRVGDGWHLRFVLSDAIGRTEIDFDLSDSARSVGPSDPASLENLVEQFAQRFPAENRLGTLQRHGPYSISTRETGEPGLLIRMPSPVR